MSEEPTDQDPQISDHLFQPMRDGWEDTCGHLDLDGWSCGYNRAEHTQGGEAAGEAP